MNKHLEIHCIDEIVKNVKSVGITGHVRPDGDCVGSTLGLYNYLHANYPDIDVTVYLEEFEPHFNFISGSDLVAHDCNGHTEPYDIFFVLDCGVLDRVANFAQPYIKKARQVVNIDHHVDGHDFADINHYDSQISSASELLYGIFDENKVTKAVAEAIYTGIIHDTGVLKYQATTAKTMEIAAKCMEKGIDFTSIIDDTFYRVTFNQNYMLGKALLAAQRELDGRLIWSHIDRATMEEYHVTGKELGNIIDQLRFTEGVEVAVFTYELADHSTKVSTRSVNTVDVNAICNALGGGGHVRAAGATVSEPHEQVIEEITKMVKEQLDRLQE